MRIGVTGANGFIGGYVCPALIEAGHDVRALLRTSGSDVAVEATAHTEIPSLDSSTDIGVLSAALEGLDAVVHLAGLAHVMDAANDDPRFDAVNRVGSLALFQAARDAGIKRFIYMSSVKAVAERSGRTPLTEHTEPSPEDAHGRSKLAAEQTLTAEAETADIALTILRPPLVYGWPPTGNIKTAAMAVSKGLPLPLASIQNRRHMIFVGNLADAVRATLASDVTVGPYFVTDGAPISTPKLFRAIGHAVGRPARLFPFPPGMLRLAGALLGKENIVSRLVENFEIDDAPFRRDAAWQPPYKMADGLRVRPAVGDIARP